MRWKAKLGEPQKTKRDVTRFALWPTRCDDDTVVWLERYRAYQEWGHSGYGYGWTTVAKYAYSPTPF